MIENVAAVGRHVKIFKAVVIVVSDGDTHAISGALQSGLLGYILERAVLFLVEQTVPILRAGFLRDAAFGRGAPEGRAIDQKNVEAPVVVVVKEGDASAHGFRQIVPGCVGREVVEMNAESGSDVGEFSWEGLTWGSRGTSLPGGSSPNE